MSWTKDVVDIVNKNSEPKEIKAPFI